MLLEQKVGRGTHDPLDDFFFFSVLSYFQSLHQEKAVPVIESSDVDMTLDVSPTRCTAVESLP